MTWEATHFGVRQRLTSHITAFDRPRHFRDSMVAGAFRRFDHDHWFDADGRGGTVMRDAFDVDGGLAARTSWDDARHWTPAPPRAIVAASPTRRRAPHPHPRETRPMCRNIKTLANFEPPASEDEIRSAALQFVRKLNGTTRPSRANEAAFARAVDDVTTAARRLLAALETAAPPRDRDVEREKAQARSRRRFGEGAARGA